MKPSEYFDAAKARLNITSDYELAKQIGAAKQHMTELREGSRNIPLDVVFKLAITLEMDPATVVADLESQRDKNEKRREFWRSFISHARAATVLCACMLALSFSVICGDGSKAGAAFFRRPKFA